MSEFEFQNGVLNIDDTTMYIRTSPLKSVKQWYHERKIIFFTFLLLILILISEAIFGVTFARQILGAVFIVLLFYLVLYVLIRLDIIGDVATISTNSVTKVVYDRSKFNYSKISIIYTDDDNNERQRVIWMSLPGMGGDSRLEVAVDTLQSEGIETISTSERD